MTTRTADNVAALSLAGIAMRAVLFAGLWWGLTEGEVDSWLVGVPAVIGATVASLLLRTEAGGRWRLVGTMQFVVFFVVESLRAGVDVARRAVTLNIEPQIIKYECSLDHEAALDSVLWYRKFAAGNSHHGDGGRHCTRPHPGFTETGR